MKPRWRRSALSIASNLAVAVASIWVGYRCSLVEPNLSYTVAEMRPLVFDNGFVPAITMKYRDEKISTNVWAMTVFVWNRGRQLIAPPFRRPPVLRTSPPVRILSARLLRESHPDVGFKIDESHRNQGVLDLSWDVLELNDGAALEIVYIGERATEVRLDGAWNGQRVLSRAPFMRRNNFTLAALIFMFIALSLMTVMVALSEKHLFFTILTAAMWIGLTLLLFRGWFFGIPRSIDVGPDIGTNVGSSVTP